MPHRIAPPSNAGPAGAAVDTMVSPSLSTISQLVPTSMNSRVRLSRSMPVASMPETMSPPTYAPRAGKTTARAPVCRASPRSEASSVGSDPAGHHERRDAERLGVDAQHQRGHRGVAGQRHLVDLVRLDPGLGEHLAGQLGQRRLRQVPEPLRGVGVHHRGADPGDHVGAEGLLLVEHRGDRGRRAGRGVDQRGHDRGGAEVEGDREPARGGVAGLDVDERLVDDHGGDLVVGLPQHAGQPAQHVQVGGQLEVVDRVEDPLQVGALVLQGRLDQLDVPLLDRRAAGSPDDRRRGWPPWVAWSAAAPRSSRSWVACARHASRQPSASCAAREGAYVETVDRDRAVEDLDLALLAGAVAAARRVDRDAVPARRVEHADAGRDPHVAAGRREGQLHPAEPSCGVEPGPSGRSISPSRRRSSTWMSGGSSLTSVIGRRRPASSGGRRSSCRPTRRGPAAGRPPSRRRRSAGCGCP